MFFWATVDSIVTYEAKDFDTPSTYENTGQIARHKTQMRVCTWPI